jgi:hypothetical protein
MIMKNHLQQRLPSASNELKCVIDNNDNGQAKTRTLSPSLTEALADKNDPTAAASLIMQSSCMWTGVGVLQCSAASIHDAALCLQEKGANPPENMKFETVLPACFGASEPIFGFHELCSAAGAPI